MHPQAREQQGQNRASAAARIALLLLTTLFLSLQVSCSTTPQMSVVNQRQVQQREVNIAAEPPGDYWIGRRWWTRGTRFRGYVRRPGQQWSESQLVMMYEGHKKTPDRLPEETVSGASHGFDHNYEYRLYGSFSGGKIYDPNSDLILPEFILRDFELLNTNPGYLFRPDERYLPSALPPKYPRHG